DQVLKVLKQAKPIQYRSNIASDDQTKIWYGLVAEDIAKLDPNLVHWGYQEADFEDSPQIINEDGSLGFKDHKRFKAGATMKPDGMQYERMSVCLLWGWQQHEARLSAIEAKLGEKHEN